MWYTFTYADAHRIRPMTRACAYGIFGLMLMDVHNNGEEQKEEEHGGAQGGGGGAWRSPRRRRTSISTTVYMSDSITNLQLVLIDCHLPKCFVEHSNLGAISVHHLDNCPLLLVIFPTANFLIQNLDNNIFEKPVAHVSMSVWRTRQHGTFGACK